MLADCLDDMSNIFVIFDPIYIQFKDQMQDLLICQLTASG